MCLLMGREIVFRSYIMLLVLLLDALHTNRTIHKNTSECRALKAAIYFA